MQIVEAFFENLGGISSEWKYFDRKVDSRTL